MTDELRVSYEPIPCQSQLRSEATVHYLRRVVPRGPADADQLADLIDFYERDQ